MSFVDDDEDDDDDGDDVDDDEERIKRNEIHHRRRRRLLISSKCENVESIIAIINIIVFCLCEWNGVRRRVSGTKNHPKLGAETL